MNKLKVLYFVHDEMAHIAKAIEELNDSRFEFFYIINDFRYYNYTPKNKTLKIYENFKLYEKPLELLPTYVKKNLYSHIMKDKAYMKTKSSYFQLGHATTITHRLLEFFKKINPDVVFFQGAEEYYTSILFDICREYNVKVLSYSPLRNFNKSSFYIDMMQKKADFFFKKRPSEKKYEEAKQFLYEFRNKINRYNDLKKDYITNKPIISYYHRIYQNIIYLFKKETKYYSQSRNIFNKMNLYLFERGIRRLINPYIVKPLFTKTFDFKIDYVYYPLHITPEVSINTPAPFWIEQIRAIDFILLSLPANYKLVVKEHPGMRIGGYRNYSFYKTLINKPGLILLDDNIDSYQLIKNSKFVIGITGTALLENFLLGGISIALGDFMFSNFIYRVNSIEELKNIFQNQNIKKPNDEEIVDIISRFLNYGYDNFFLDSPNRYGKVLKQENIKNSLDAMYDFLQR